MNKISFLNIMMLFLVIEQCQSKPFYLLSLTPSADTILAGTSLAIMATVKDTLGNEYPSYESSLRWSLSSDSKLNIAGKTATLIATKAYQTDTVGAMLFFPQTGASYFAKSLITILPNRPYRVHIEKDSTPANLWHADSTDTARITDYSSTIHLYAIERDTFGNYTGMAKNVSWVLLRSGIISVSSSLDKKGEVKISAIDSGVCPLVLVDSTLVSDTAYIYIAANPTVCVQFPKVVGKFKFNSVNEIYDLKGKKLCRNSKYISGAFIIKNGYTYYKRVRIDKIQELHNHR